MYLTKGIVWYVFLKFGIDEDFDQDQDYCMSICPNFSEM